ncbi:MAG TPA: response regulator [Tepidisphaeraceae bacterium]|nr:response regulator [Tepidisphaeraceae bacterium]
MLNILLVDDSKTMRAVQRRALETMGPCSFSEAGDGEEALSVIGTAGAPFDFIMIDWNMPKMDGLTLVKKIRETNKTTPLIMCTTEAEKSRVVEAIKAGVNNYAIKPFTPETLIDRVKQTLAKAKPAGA